MVNIHLFSFFLLFFISHTLFLKPCRGTLLLLQILSGLLFKDVFDLFVVLFADFVQIWFEKVYLHDLVSQAFVLCVRLKRTDWITLDFELLWRLLGD